MMDQLELLPVTKQYFDRSPGSFGEAEYPFIEAGWNVVNEFLSRRVIMEELPYLAQAAFHLREFFTCFRLCHSAFDQSPFDQKFSVLKKFAQQLGDLHAASVFDGMLQKAKMNQNEYLYDPAKEFGGGALQIKRQHPDFEPLISLFARNNSFLETADSYLRDHWRLAFQETNDWIAAIKDIIEQIPDYWKREESGGQIFRQAYVLCEPLGARITHQDHSDVFAWSRDQHVNTARNDFAPKWLDVRGVHTTQGYFWMTTFRDAYTLVDSATHRELVRVKHSGLLSERFLMSDEAPGWRLDPVKKRLTKPSRFEKLRQSWLN